MHKTNFGYLGMVYKMQRLPMGLKNAVYMAQKDALLAYSDANLEIFLQEKGIKKGLPNFRFIVWQNFS